MEPPGEQTVVKGPEPVVGGRPLWSTLSARRQYWGQLQQTRGLYWEIGGRAHYGSSLSS